MNMKADHKTGNDVLSEGDSALTVKRFVGSVPTDKEELNGCRLSSDILATAVNRMKTNGESSDNKKAAPHRYDFI